VSTRNLEGDDPLINRLQFLLDVTQQAEADLSEQARELTERVARLRYLVVKAHGDVPFEFKCSLGGMASSYRLNPDGWFEGEMAVPRGEPRAWKPISTADNLMLARWLSEEVEEGTP